MSDSFYLDARVENAPQKTAEQLDVIDQLPRAVQELVNRDAFDEIRNDLLDPPDDLDKQGAATLRNQTMQMLLIRSGGVRQEVKNICPLVRRRGI